MTAIAVNERNDIYLDDVKNVAMTSGITQVLQQCEQAIKALLGEMVFNQQRGMPYFETVFLQTDLPRWEAAAYAAIERVPGVIEVLALESSLSGDTMRYNAAIRTIHGTGLITSG